MGDGGLEPTPFSSGNTPFSETGGAESGAVGARNGTLPPDLAAVVAAWPTLSEAIKTDIVTMVTAADGTVGRADR